MDVSANLRIIVSVPVLVQPRLLVVVLAGETLVEGHDAEVGRVTVRLRFAEGETVPLPDAHMRVVARIHAGEFSWCVQVIAPHIRRCRLGAGATREARHGAGDGHRDVA